MPFAVPCGFLLRTPTPGPIPQAFRVPSRERLRARREKKTEAWLRDERARRPYRSRPGLLERFTWSSNMYQRMSGFRRLVQEPQSALIALAGEQRALHGRDKALKRAES